MRFAAHYHTTYMPELDGPQSVFYDHLFEQMELLDRLGFDDVWVTEHHFSEYGGMISHPPTFLSAIARTTQQIHLGVAVSVSVGVQVGVIVGVALGVAVGLDVLVNVGVAVGVIV